MHRPIIAVFFFAIGCSGSTITTSVTCQTESGTVSSQSGIAGAHCGLVSSGIDASATATYSITAAQTYVSVEAGAEAGTLPGMFFAQTSAAVSLSLDFTTSGPVRPGIMVQSLAREGSIDNMWGGWTSGPNNMSGAQPVTTTLPFTLGTIFTIVQYGAAASTPPGAHIRGGGTASTFLWFTLYEMNPDGSQGAIVTPTLATALASAPVATPEPSSGWPMLGILAIAVAARAQRSSRWFPHSNS